MKILLAEDDPDLQDALKEFLTEKGHDVTAVNNGQLALDTLRKHPEDFDVVITDQNMPELKGTQLAEHILVERYQADVICFSSDVDNHGFPRNLFTKCVKKPNHRELLDYVESLK